MATKKKTTAEPAEPKFTKAQLYRSKRFAAYKDAIDAWFDDGKTYTLAEAQALLDSKMKGVK